jgi:hypothetical protein
MLGGHFELQNMLRIAILSTLLLSCAAQPTEPPPVKQPEQPVQQQAPQAAPQAAQQPAQQTPQPTAAAQDPTPKLSPELERLVATLAEQNVQLDASRGIIAIPVDIDVRDDLLEYLLVGPSGAAHESVFVTPVKPSVLNAALIALGASPGTNAIWKPKNPPPSEAELRAGAPAYDVQVPQGDGFFLYSGWKVGDEVFFFRIEDMIRNLGTGQSMTRHAWVYLGSRMVESNRKGHEHEQQFAADLYQNLISVVFFSDGYPLLTGALPECVDQHVWMANAWLLPERGTRVALFLSRKRIDRLPAELEPWLPVVTPAKPPGAGGGK